MNLENTNPRRAFFKESIAIGAGLSATVAVLSSFYAEATTTTDPNKPMANTEKDFRMILMPHAELSLITSQIAVAKARQKNAKEFAGFELTEAIAVTGVLKDLGTPVPPMDAKASATLAKIKAAPAGAAFDKAYIEAQLENHEFLVSLAENYIMNAKGRTSPAESQTRHLATLALATFKEHVMITKRILGELGM